MSPRVKLIGGVAGGFLLLIILISGFGKDNSQVATQENKEVQTTVLTTEKVQEKTPTVQKQNDYVSIVSVVDGDTIKVSIAGETKPIRLIGIDTPETVDPRKPVQCFGIEASNKAKELLLGKSVRLEADQSQGELDKYNRLLRYVFLKDGTSFNKWMIANGYAHEYTYQTPYKYQAEFKVAEQNARNKQLGLWNPTVCPVDVTLPPVQIQTQTPVPSLPAQPQTISAHTFYTSSYYSAKYYYCDTDDGWKSLSPTYLKSFSNETELLAKYARTLHEPCK